MRHHWGLSVAILGAGVSASLFSGCVGDSGTPDTDATTDSVAPDVTAPKDSPVVDTGPTGCQARTADDNAGIFVATSGSDVSGCGARANPCKTIVFSLAAAKATTTKTTLYLASGTYQESVNLDTPVTIEGGWKDTGGTWTPICDATISTAVVIQGTTNQTIHAAFTGSATLRYVKVASKTPADPGESLYGVFASGSATNLTLDTIAVDVVGGGTGTNGTPGATGSNASDAGCTASNGGAGGAGANGAGGAAGTFSSTGYVATNGGDAGTGGTGNGGTAGTNGACATCETFTGSCPSTCAVGNKTVCANNGTAGCGGLGGTGGSLGVGGGASIAVYVWDAHLTVFGGTFTTSNGGNGGIGGAGADGGAGAGGFAGSNASCATQINGVGCFGNFCSGTLVSSYTLDGGSAGGSGGAGGTGGQGGGGSGGPSYAIVQGGDAGITLNANPKLAHGDGGTGGAFGGASGVSADRFP